MTEFIDEVKLTEDGGVIKKMISEGEDCMPEEGDQCKVHYEGRLEDGTVFDSSYERNDPLELSVGEGQVIKGWDIGIGKMKLGEKAELHIQSDYGYGDAGSPPKIPGGATLIFKVELVQIKDRKAGEKSDPELLKLAQQYKDDGNGHFKEGKNQEAVQVYMQGVENIEKIRKPTEETNKLAVVIYQNMSLACNKLNKHKMAIRWCTKAFKLDNNAAKALYIRSQAYQAQKNIPKAMDDIKAAIKLSPQDKNFRALFEKIKKAKTDEAKSYAGKMQQMFTSGGIYDEKETPKNIKTCSQLPEYEAENVQTFFDIEIGNEGEEKEKGRVVFEVFSKQVPKTAENFRQLCTMEHGESFGYKNSIFHRVIKGFMAQGGDFTNRNGTGGKSIYGEKFDDEQIWYPHTTKGVLSMANSGPNTNGSQFFLCFGPTPHLDQKHTIFGRIIKGYDFIDKVEANPSDGGDKPLKGVTVVDCGELKGDDKVTPDPELVKVVAAPADAADDDDDDDEEEKEEEEEEDDKEGGEKFVPPQQPKKEDCGPKKEDCGPKG